MEVLSDPSHCMGLADFLISSGFLECHEECNGTYHILLIFIDIFIHGVFGYCHVNVPSKTSDIRTFDMFYSLLL